MAGAVVVRNLVKQYGKFEALHGISFSVNPGEVFGVIGVNGAGKTTTLRIIATLLRPTAGEVRVYDHDVVSEAHRIRSIMAFLPEEAGTYKHLSGIEFLKFIAELRIPDKKKREENIEWAVKVTGLGDKIYNRTGTYSKGMKRRLLVAATLMSHPRLAILDEPTAGLDVLHSVFLRKVIRDYVKNTGAALILSSHNMLEVEYMCDRIAIIHKGNIIEKGVPRELKDKYSVANLEEVFQEVVKNV